MEFRILGPLEVWTGGHRIPIRGDRQVRALAALLVDAGSVVPLGRLIDAVWDTAPPPTARSQVHNFVSRLRGALLAAPAPGSSGDSTPLVRDSSGYRLDVGTARVDATEFRRGVDRARRLAGEGA